MKAFFNVFGALGLLLGVAAFALSKGAFQEAEGCIMILVGIVAAGFGHAFHLASARAEREVKQHKELLALLESLKPTPKRMPPIPGEERYYCVAGGQVMGPHPIDRLRDMYAKTMLKPDSWVLREGADSWMRLDTAFEL